MEFKVIARLSLKLIWSRRSVNGYCRRQSSFSDVQAYGRALRRSVVMFPSTFLCTTQTFPSDLLQFLSLCQVFDQCRCVASAGPQPGNLTSTLGQCPHRDSCDRVFPFFLAMSVLSSFIISLGGTPGFVLLIRSVNQLLLCCEIY